jgi:glycosyltransferase involved in cell wall biosynthesis
MKLTIAIPTYKRNQLLKRTLKLILPQLQENIDILIIDNNSPVPVEKEVNELIGVCKCSNKVAIVRNEVNIGMSANIIRCFEKAQGDWMWLLGDDDLPLSNAVETISETIETYSHVAYIMYSFKRFSHKKTEEFEASSGIKEDRFFGGLTFMSVGVFNLSKVRQHICFAYEYAYAYAPHYVLIAAAVYLGKSKILYSEKEIVTEGERLDASLCFSWQKAKLRFLTLVELPFFDDSQKKRTLNGIIRTTYPNWKSVCWDACYFLCGEFLGSIQKGSGRFFMTEFYCRYRMIGKKPLNVRLAFIISLIFFRIPKLGWLILKVFPGRLTVSYIDIEQRV